MSLLKWVVLLLGVSLIAALLGFTDVAQSVADISRVLFYVFLAGCAVLFTVGLARLNTPPRRGSSVTHPVYRPDVNGRSPFRP